MRRTPEFGLTPREASLLRRLGTPARIQRFLDEDVRYDLDDDPCRSPRRVIRERLAKCLDGALFAAAALRFQGHPPLLVYLSAVEDSDHVIAVYRTRTGWGSIARSNFTGLRSREPIHGNLRELVLTYFDGYYNLRREKTLRAFSRPVDVSRFDGRGWMTAEEDLWYISSHLQSVPHRRILSQEAERSLATVDRRTFTAGLVGHRYPRGKPAPRGLSVLRSRSASSGSARS